MRSLLPIAFAVCMLAGSPTASLAQKKPTPKKKPVAAAQKKPTAPPVLGTKQMAGDQAVLGTEYTLGKSEPMNIKVTRVEYRADRILAGDTFYEPDKQHKLLLVYFTWHNPVPTDRYVRYDLFQFIAVDKAGANHEYVQGVFRPDTLEPVAMTLKPGQKVDAFTLLLLPAKGDVEKLIVQSGDDRVLRYPLAGKVKPIPAPYADPEDKTGFTAREEIPAQIGVAFPLPLTEPSHQDAFDITVDGITTTTASLTDDEQPEGTHNVVVSIRLKNASPTGGKFFRFDSLLAELLMDDGSTIEAKQRLLHATANRDVDFTLSKGAEVKCRFYFETPTDAKAKKLIIRGPNVEGRAYVFTL